MTLVRSININFSLNIMNNLELLEVYVKNKIKSIYKILLQNSSGTTLKTLYTRNLRKIKIMIMNYYYPRLNYKLNNTFVLKNSSNFCNN